jgi:hypothetical protein
VKNEGLAGAINNVFDHILRKAQAPEVVYASAAFERLIDQGRW